MKKYLQVIIKLIISFKTMIAITSCSNNSSIYLDQFDEQDISCNNIIPDLKQSTQQITSDRNDSDNLKTWLEQEEQKPERDKKRWLNVTKRKKQFAANLESKIKLKASTNSILAFEKLANNYTKFKDFNDLQMQLDHFNLGHTTVKIPWTIIINQLSSYSVMIENYQREICRFYNIFAQVYGQDNVLKMVYRIQSKNFSGSIMAQTYFNSYKPNNNDDFIQIMAFDNVAFNRFTIEHSYKIGWFASKNMIETVVHEYGHALANFLRLDKAQRQKINSLADNDLNQWWNNYFNSNQHSNTNKLLPQTFDETKYLVSSLAKKTNIHQPIYQKLLAYGIIRSNYGRMSDGDLFAEAFVQWILTPNMQRNVAWEKLDQFFRIELPKLL